MPKRPPLAASKRLAQSSASAQSVAQLEAMLNDQQARKQSREDAAFLEQRAGAYSQSRARAFPRTFENKQFFTPHLRREQQQVNDPVKREYVLVLNNGMVVRQSTKTRSAPIQEFSASQWTAIARQRVRDLEAQGWIAVGHNADMIELERLYNPRMQARDATWRAAKRYAVGAITLTMAIYAGQFFMS